MLNTQAKVTVHALSGGSLTLPEIAFVQPCDDPDGRRTVPSLAFLVQHQDIASNKKTRVVFDLGLKRDTSGYCEAIRKHCRDRQPLTTEPDVAASLRAGGLQPEDIDIVILSHVHWDHIGTPSDFSNEKTTFVVGAGALDLLSGKTKLDIGSHSNFERDLLPLHRTIELPTTNTRRRIAREAVSTDESRAGYAAGLLKNTWQVSDAFPHVLDLFGDGLVLIVDAPGHLPGHMNLLIRLHDRQIYLAGDAFHDPRLLSGEKEIAEWKHGETLHCAHANKKAAQQTIKRVRDARDHFDASIGPMEIIFAHDAEWARAAAECNKFWPGSI